MDLPERFPALRTALYRVQLLGSALALRTEPLDHVVSVVELKIAKRHVVELPRQDRSLMDGFDGNCVPRLILVIETMPFDQIPVVRIIDAERSPVALVIEAASAYYECAVLLHLDGRLFSSHPRSLCFLLLLDTSFG